MTVRLIGPACLGLAVVAVLYGQATMAPTHFEVASLKVSSVAVADPARGFGRVMGGPGSADPGQFTVIGMSLKDLLFMLAYNLDEHQYSAPSWMANEIFEVVAKVPPGTTQEQFRVMLQNLLIERFQIEMRHEQRELTTYDLVIAKGGVRMKPSKFAPDAPPAPSPGSGGSVHMDRDGDGLLVIPANDGPRTLMTMINRQTEFVTNKASVQKLIDFLSRNLHITIADKTGLQGDFAFMLHFQPEGLPPLRNAREGAEAPAPVATVYEALQSQLGLKLDKHTGPVDVLVIDKAEKTPVEN
jgi:uncharacterized protein (TIGR03435 family)